MVIPYEVKKKCIELANAGLSSRAIYDQYFNVECGSQAYDSFRVSLARWRKKEMADSHTLYAGTYEGFIPHNATVQVNGEGEIVQAWIKQTKEQDLERMLEVVKDLPKVEYIEPIITDDPSGMLEIPLFDMHFGINSLADYQDTLMRVLSLIQSKKWECINIIIGQDLLHNNDFRGGTANYTQIESVDIEKAVQEAKTFYFSILRKAKQCCDDVRVYYSKGNHDESLSYMFFLMLEQAFGEQMTFDSSTDPRKCILWHDIFIAFGHCDKGRVNPKDVRMQFTIEFASEFGNSKVREIHLGHLHTEMKDGDECGVVVRRLSTANKTDEWHKERGYVGNHKRFQLFEYSRDRLTSIHYV